MGPNLSDNGTGIFWAAFALFAVGFIPGYVVSGLFRMVGALRIPEKAELMGMDLAKVLVSAYAEDFKVPEAVPAPA